MCRGLNICVALIRAEQRRLEERLRQLREEEERLVKETADEQQLQRTADEVSGGEKMRRERELVIGVHFRNLVGWRVV